MEPHPSPANNQVMKRSLTLLLPPTTSWNSASHLCNHQSMVLKKTGTKDKWPHNSLSSVCEPELSTPAYLACSPHRHLSATQANFTPSIYLNLGLSCTRPPLISAINTFLSTVSTIWYSSIVVIIIDRILLPWTILSRFNSDFCKYLLSFHQFGINIC